MVKICEKLLRGGIEWKTAEGGGVIKKKEPVSNGFEAVELRIADEIANGDVARR
jgi:hypothetical protein